MNLAAKLLAGLIALVLLAGLIDSLSKRANCTYYGYQTERNVRYAAFVGCMVQTQNGWVPRGEIRSPQ